MPPRTTFSSGTFKFRTDAPYNPADPATFPFQFNVTVGPPDDYGYPVFSRDRRYNFFAEGRMRVSGTSPSTSAFGTTTTRRRQTARTTSRRGSAWRGM